MTWDGLTGGVALNRSIQPGLGTKVVVDRTAEDAIRFASEVMYELIERYHDPEQPTAPEVDDLAEATARLNGLLGVIRRERVRATGLPD